MNDIKQKIILQVTIIIICSEQGRFEILSLTGSFMPSDNGLAKSRSGGMSVSLAGPDGRVLGGGLAGMLIAAGPIQVSVLSYIVMQSDAKRWYFFPVVMVVIFYKNEHGYNVS